MELTANTSSFFSGNEEWIEGISNEVLVVWSAFIGAVVLLAYTGFSSCNSGSSLVSSSSKRKKYYVPATVLEAKTSRPATDPVQPFSCLNCVLCEKELRSASESYVCGHTFCGACFIKYWEDTRKNEDYPAYCPVDHCLVRSITPNFTLRSLTNATNNVDAKLFAYNAKFTVSPRNKVRESFRAVRHMFNGFGSLPLIYRVYFIVAGLTSVAYVLAPFDMLPEGSMGAYVILGLVDDLMFTIFILYMLGNVYRRDIQAVDGD